VRGQRLACCRHFSKRLWVEQNGKKYATLVQRQRKIKPPLIPTDFYVLFCRLVKKCKSKVNFLAADRIVLRVFKANTFGPKGSDYVVVESLFWKKRSLIQRQPLNPGACCFRRWSPE
jgi:hypothetical protein